MQARSVASLAAWLVACGGTGDAPKQTAVQGTVDGQRFAAWSSWATVSNAPANSTLWARVSLLDAFGTCDDAAIIPRAGATEVHLFVSSNGSPIVPGRYSTETADAAGLIALIGLHRYDGTCTETFTAYATGFVELDTIGTTVTGSFDGTDGMTGDRVQGTFVAAACPVPDAGTPPACL
jgi:hypothetical protein